MFPQQLLRTTRHNYAVRSTRTLDARTLDAEVGLKRGIKRKASAVPDPLLNQRAVPDPLAAQRAVPDPLAAQRAYAKRGKYIVKSWADGGNQTPVVSARQVIRHRGTSTIYEVEGKGQESSRRGRKPKQVNLESGWLVETEEDGEVKEYFVVDEDFVRPVWKSDDFAMGHVDQQKLMANALFLNVLRDYPREDRQVVYLDSPMGLTTFGLHAAGLSQEQLHLVNHDPDFEGKTTARVTDEAQVFTTSLFEWFRDSGFEDGEVFDVGADYCCTFDGNPCTQPKADFKMMFQRRLLAPHNGVLWGTFSRRSSKAGRVCEYVKYIDHWMQVTAQSYGYKLKLVKSDSYRTIVYFFWVSTQ